MNADDDDVAEELSSIDEDEDDMVSDTRWVKLTELATNMGEGELKELDMWAAGLQRRPKPRVWSSGGAASERVRWCAPTGAPWGLRSPRGGPTGDGLSKDSLSSLIW